jgi:hypothetical protein
MKSPDSPFYQFDPPLMTTAIEKAIAKHKDKKK